MAYRCSFLDNEAYTAQDVNDIFARVTHGGVLFTDTGYTLGDLNASASNLSTEGVTRDPDSCRVVKKSGVYKISKGSCIMNDGTAIIFDADGQEIEIVENQTNYVYLSRNIAEDTIDIVVSVYPGDENSVPLAEIDDDGIIYDRRRYAKAKADIGEAGTLRNFTAHFAPLSALRTETVTLDFGDEMFSYIVVWDGQRVSSSGNVEKRVANTRNLVPLIDGEEVPVSIGEKQGGHKEYIRCTKDGQKLHIYLSGAYTGSNYTMNLGVI